MKKSIFYTGPYLNGNRPKPFLTNLADFYNKKVLTSSGGKKFNPLFGLQAC